MPEDATISRKGRTQFGAHDEKRLRQGFATYANHERISRGLREAEDAGGQTAVPLETRTHNNDKRRAADKNTSSEP